MNGFNGIYRFLNFTIRIIHYTIPIIIFTGDHRFYYLIAYCLSSQLSIKKFVSTYIYLPRLLCHVFLALVIFLMSVCFFETVNLNCILLSQICSYNLVVLTACPQKKISYLYLKFGYVFGSTIILITIVSNKNLLAFVIILVESLVILLFLLFAKLPRLALFKSNLVNQYKQVINRLFIFLPFISSILMVEILFDVDLKVLHLSCVVIIWMRPLISVLCLENTINKKVLIVLTLYIAIVFTNLNTFYSIFLELRSCSYSLTCLFFISLLNASVIDSVGLYRKSDYVKFIGIFKVVCLLSIYVFNYKLNAYNFLSMIIMANMAFFIQKNYNLTSVSTGSSLRSSL